MRVPGVSHGLVKGTTLFVDERPFWAEFIEQHWPAGPSRFHLDTPWWHLTQWVFKFTHRHTTRILEVPITDEQADQLHPGAFSWVDDDLPPIQKNVRVRLIPRKGTLDRPGETGSVIDIIDISGEPENPEFYVKFDSGFSGYVRRNDLVDIRLAWER